MNDTDDEKALTPPAGGTPCAKQEHEAFAQRVAVHGNASSAYRAVYAGADDNGANASRLVRHPDVVRRVAELQKAHREQVLRETEDIGAFVADVMTARGGELFDENGDQIPFHELPRSVRLSISGVDFDLDDDGNVLKYKLKFPDPLAAARLLAQLRGMLVERQDVTSGGRSLSPLVPVEAAADDIQAELRRQLRPPIEDAEFSETTVPEAEPKPDPAAWDLL